MSQSQVQVTTNLHALRYSCGLNRRPLDHCVGQRIKAPGLGIPPSVVGKQVKAIEHQPNETLLVTLE